MPLNTINFINTYLHTLYHEFMDCTSACLTLPTIYLFYLHNNTIIILQLCQTPHYIKMKNKPGLLLLNTTQYVSIK